MSTLAEIEAAAELLPPEQKEELFRFLANTLLLEAPPEAPPMTTETIKILLEEFP